MITSTSFPHRTLQPEFTAASSKHLPPPVSQSVDQISIVNTVSLRAELARYPAVRPEAVARARMLAADPNYPQLAAVRVVADQILRSPDLSEEIS